MLFPQKQKRRILRLFKFPQKTTFLSIFPQIFFAQPVDIVNNLVENLRFKDFYCG